MDDLGPSVSSHGELCEPGDARPFTHAFWQSKNTLAFAVWIFEFELIVQQRQQIRIPTFSRHPSAVQKLPVNQRTNALNDLDLALNKTNRSEFVQHRQVRLRFHPLTKLKCKPFPIRCEVAAHQQHNSHDACNKFSETDRDRDDAPFAGRSCIHPAAKSESSLQSVAAKGRRSSLNTRKTIPRCFQLERSCLQPLPTYIPSTDWVLPCSSIAIAARQTLHSLRQIETDRTGVPSRDRVKSRHHHRARQKLKILPAATLSAKLGNWAIRMGRPHERRNRELFPSLSWMR